MTRSEAEELTQDAFVVVDIATGDIITVGPGVAADLNPVSWAPDDSALLINRYDGGDEVTDSLETMQFGN